MKKLYTFLGTILLTSLCYAQPGVEAPEPSHSSSAKNIQFFDNERNSVDSCGAWTGYYLLHKLTGLEAYYLSIPSEYSGHAQYYSAPQPLEIRGVGFYGFAENVDSVQAIVELREASPVDSLPGAVLASDTVYVQQGVYQNNFLGQQYYEVFFNTPVVVNSGYNITVQNITNDTLQLYSNSYSNSDGNGEYLNSLYYSDPAFPGSEGWYRSSAFGPSFDADFLILPILKTEIFEPYLLDPNDTICEGTNFCVEYNRKPIFDDHLYADSSFISMQSIDWDWGNGFGVNGVDIACHMYDSTSMVTLTDTFYYYNAPNQQVLTCDIEESTTVTVFKEPTIDFDYTVNGSTVTFTNNSYNALNYQWDFGDGNTSTDVNPTHTYTGDSTYIIVLTGTNPCFSDSLSDTLIIDNASVLESHPNQVTIYPNPADDFIQIKGERDLLGKKVQIRDAAGKLVNEFINEHEVTKVNVSDWSKGIYFLSIPELLIHEKILIE